MSRHVHGLGTARHSKAQHSTALRCDTFTPSTTDVTSVMLVLSVEMMLRSLWQLSRRFALRGGTQLTC